MAEQKAFLSTNSPAAILINCQTSPDRGSLRFMTQTLTKNTHYYLVGEVFVTDWQQALLGVGVPHNTITKLVE